MLRRFRHQQHHQGLATLRLFCHHRHDDDIGITATKKLSTTAASAMTMKQQHLQFHQKDNDHHHLHHHHQEFYHLHSAPSHPARGSSSSSSPSSRCCFTYSSPSSSTSSLDCIVLPSFSYHCYAAYASNDEQYHDRDEVLFIMHHPEQERQQILPSIDSSTTSSGGGGTATTSGSGSGGSSSSGSGGSGSSESGGDGGGCCDGQRCAKLSAERDRFRRELEDCLQDRAVLDSRVTELCKTVAAHEAEIKRLQALLLDKDNEIKRLNSKIATLEQEIALLKKNNTSVNNSIVVLQNDNKLLKNDNEFLMGTVKCLVADRNEKLVLIAMSECATHLRRKMCDAIDRQRNPSSAKQLKKQAHKGSNSSKVITVMQSALANDFHINIKTPTDVRAINNALARFVKKRNAYAHGDSWKSIRKPPDVMQHILAGFDLVVKDLSLSPKCKRDLRRLLVVVCDELVKAKAAPQERL